MSHLHTETVRFGDLDANRHLNNVVFLRYFESARIAYLQQVLPAHQPTRPEDDPSGMIFAECHINYRSPVLFDETVGITCRISTVRRSSFRVEFDMRVDQRLVAEGYGVVVAYDYANAQAAQLPDEVRAALEAEEAAS